MSWIQPARNTRQSTLRYHSNFVLQGCWKLNVDMSWDWQKHFSTYFWKIQSTLKWLTLELFILSLMNQRPGCPITVTYYSRRCLSRSVTSLGYQGGGRRAFRGDPNFASIAIGRVPVASSCEQFATLSLSSTGHSHNIRIFNVAIITLLRSFKSNDDTFVRPTRRAMLFQRNLLTGQVIEAIAK